MKYREDFPVWVRQGPTVLEKINVGRLFLCFYDTKKGAPTLERINDCPSRYFEIIMNYLISQTSVVQNFSGNGCSGC